MQYITKLFSTLQMWEITTALGNFPAVFRVNARIGLG